MQNLKHHVIVIGGGPCGLLIAQGLKKHGVSFSIFEKAPRQLERDWGVTMHWSLDIVKELTPPSIADRISEAQTDPYAPVQEEVFFRNGKTGEKLAGVSVPHAREISARKLKLLLSEGIDVQRGKSLTDFKIDQETGTVQAIFEDGRMETGTILVGADGSGSAVRRLLFADGSEPEILPYTMMNLKTTYTSEQALFLKERVHPLTDIGVHPDGKYCRFNILDVPDLSKPEGWTFQLLTTWPATSSDKELRTSEQKLARLRQQMSDWADPQGSAARWVAEDAPIHTDNLKQWKPRRWNSSQGRVTLAGDAAHTTTFHRGQGVNNAVGDAELFVKKMVIIHDRSQDSLFKEISEYEEDVIKRGSLEVQYSLENTKGIHKGNEFLQQVHKYGTGRSTEVSVLPSSN